MQVAVIHTAFEDTPTVVAYVDTSTMLINTASKEEALTRRISLYSKHFWFVVDG